MRRLLAIGGTTLALAGFTAAAEPTGLWRVANGEADIRIDDCGGALWGIIAWEKKAGNLDSQNPNPALRGRPTLGIPVLIAMRPTKPNLWQGAVYDAENGKTYDSRLSLASPDVLHIEGCVLGGLICGGENWARLPQAAARSAAVHSACSGIPDAAGTTHKGRLK